MRAASANFKASPWKAQGLGTPAIVKAVGIGPSGDYFYD
jgi:hypothetical protein